jgi:hypothetical protein
LQSLDSHLGSGDPKVLCYVLTERKTLQMLWTFATKLLNTARPGILKKINLSDGDDGPREVL